MSDESEFTTTFEPDGKRRTRRLAGRVRKAINKARKKERRFFENNPGVYEYERAYIPGEDGDEGFRRHGKCPTRVAVLLTDVCVVRAYYRGPLH